MLPSLDDFLNYDRDATVVFPGHISLFGAQQQHAEVNCFSFVNSQRKMTRDEIGYEEESKNTINEMQNQLPGVEIGLGRRSPLLKLLIMVIRSSGGTSCVDSQ